MAKRLFDCAAASLALIILAPFLGLVAILIRLDSPGPVLHLGERVGRDGCLFKIYKLRTMVAGADRIGPALTQGRDPRVTRIGRVLRKWKVDELPQLLNVVRGEMSLVGPRPEAPVYVRYYTPEQRQVLRVRPGITGPTQIVFRHEEALLRDCQNLEEAYVQRVMPHKLKLDLDYARSQSLSGDLRLILVTLACLLQAEGQASETIQTLAQAADLGQGSCSKQTTS